MRRLLLTALALVVAAALALAGRALWARRETLEPLHGSNGVTYILYTHVPDACAAGGCPVLYLLDGAAWLPTFAEIDDDLNARHRITPVVIVGIGYQNFAMTGDLRKKDFTPAFGRTPGKTGGADAFMSVLRDEIIPYAEAHLPIAGERRGLAGHSYAGLFATYALAREPDLFDRTLIMSPALWFDGGKIYNIEFAPASAPRQVFLAADTPRGQARSAMANDTIKLNDILAAHSDITTTRALIVGESHESMVAPAAQRGLLALYGATP